MSDQKLQELPAPYPELVNYIVEHPEQPISEIIEPYRKYEAQLRSIFAQDRKSALLEDPHVNVLPLFTKNTKNIKTRARNLAAESQEEKDRYIMPLPENKRRPDGSPAVVQSLQEFRKNFGIFSESSLVDMDWSNIVAAGSSVVNCLVPVPQEFTVNKRKLREYYHEKFCPASDVDLFLYGLTHEEAVEKIKQIEQAIRDAILTEVTVVRTKYAITIASQYPTRHVQIVLRVYKSIGEILTGFDIDAAGGAYDGSQVWVTPRALGSFITQINHIDLTRRSPSYENRLSKYSHRNFEVYWPELDRSRVDPTIFERSFQRTLGLARLLVLERLPTSTVRETYLNKRRQERGRPVVNRNHVNRLWGNIKDSHEDEVADWVDETDVSNYHTFTVPYGEKFHAKKIEKLCYTKDLLLNAEWNQHKQREVYLHRHPAFFGRVEDVIEDCCGNCPKPSTPEEIEVAKKEAEIYIKGKVSFLIDDPGRQQIGSFNPLTENDWTDMAYVGNTARLCQSIVDCDLQEVEDWLSQEGADPNQRDYTGRSPLHLAAISSTPEIVRCLVDHGARLTARLADGTTALHLAAQRGIAEMVTILMDRSMANEAEELDEQDRRRLALREKTQSQPAPLSKQQDEPDSDGESIEDSDLEVIDAANTDTDDQSFVTGSFVNVKKAEEGKQADPELNESNEDPDFYKSDVLAWDVPCSPLHLAIAEGHEEVVTLLCNYGSDSLLPVKFLNEDKEPTGALLTLVLALALPKDEAKSMASLLLKLGATSSQADMNGCTAFHRYVQHGDRDLIDVLWDNDKMGVKTAINHLVAGDGSYYNTNAMGPLHTAIQNGDTILVLKLLNAGANPEIDFETWLKAAKFSSSVEKRLGDYESNKRMFHQSIEQPLIVAIQSSPDPEVALQLIEMGADPNVTTSHSREVVSNEWSRRYYKGETALDLVRQSIKRLKSHKAEHSSTQKVIRPEGMQEYLDSLPRDSYQHWITANDVKTQTGLHRDHEKDQIAEEKKQLELQQGIEKKSSAIQELLEGFVRIEQALIQKDAKGFYEIYPDIEKPDRGYERSNTNGTDNGAKQKPNAYKFDISFRDVTDVTESRKSAYLELFEAAWTGNVDAIKKVTLQAWGKDQEEPPLKIAVTDMNRNSPFSLAFLRGHYEAAETILEVVKLQYSPEEEEESRYKLANRDNDDDEESYNSEEDEDSDNDSDHPKIVSEAVNKKFTIDNIGQVSMQVKSQTKPLQVIIAEAPCFTGVDDTRCNTDSLFSFSMKTDNHTSFNFLLGLGIQYAKEKLKGDDEDAPGYFSFPENSFQYAVKDGKTTFLAEIIKQTGAGMPLDHLVKKSGVELKEKPKYYQGLTVYGKKRKDWATAGRNLVVKSTGLRIPPLLHAALCGSIESVEWFLADAPHRCYVEFGQSASGAQDPRLKHLNQTRGGFDRAVSKWLGIQNELVIHCAVMGPPTEQTNKLVKYLMQACPNSLEYKSTAGDTPLFLAFYLGRTSFAQTLIDGGANQAVRNNNGDNLVHAAVHFRPKAEKLEPLLDLLDKDLRGHLLLQRNNLHESGTTPLHTWVQDFCQTDYQRNGRHTYTKDSFKYKGYANKEEGIAVLKLLTSYSNGAELEMLNGAGDTPLHSAVMAGNVDLVEALVEMQPRLLYRENAVGRTPVEMARGHMVYEKFQKPDSLIASRNQTKVVEYVLDRSPEDFLEDENTEDGENNARSWYNPRRPRRGHNAEKLGKRMVWSIISNHLVQDDDKRRRLVSLGEANDVAKRLGENFNSARYFSIQARAESDDEEEDDSKEDSSDFAAHTKMQKAYDAWRSDPAETLVE